MCSYWFIECLAVSGDVDQARSSSSRRCTATPTTSGLYAEEMDGTGRYLGNFPQAFTHLGLIGAALRLDQALSIRVRH